MFKTAVAVGGAAASYLFGGWSSLLGILLAFVVIDYVSGVVAAALEGKLNSEIGLRGIAKKVMIFAIVAAAHLVDQALGGQSNLFRDAAIFFYLANELLSITENAGRMGLPIPKKIVEAIDVLKGEGKRDQNLH